MAKSHIGTCVYCGHQGEMTDDHVVPQCLFLPPLPQDIPVVDACAKCNNNEKALDDSYLRDVLVCDFDTQHHPVVAQLFATKFASAIRPKRTKKGRLVYQSALPWDMQRSQAQQMDVRTPGGIYVGRAYVARLPHDRISRIITRMVRGLHQYYLGIPLPPSASVQVGRVHDISVVLPIAQALVQSGLGHFKPVGDSTIFNCIYAQDASQPGTSIWYLGFYSSAVYQVTVNWNESAFTL